TEPTPTEPAEPLEPVLAPVAEVDAGGQTTCRVTASGNAQCAGENAWGQIGVGDTRDRLRFTQVGLPGEWARISTSGSSTCGIKVTGDLYCWGMNSSGQLGIGDAPQQWLPQRVGAGTDWTHVDVGWTTACGIKAPGTLWCWGGNYNGQLGLGDKTSRRVPAPVGGATDWASVTVGGWHVCALSTAGAASCAGRNDLGQLGTGSLLGTVGQTPVRTTARFASLDAGWSTTCGLSVAGQVRCWGLNDRGQIGDGTTVNRVVPTLTASEGRTFATVNLGDAHACALGVDGKVACWGSDRYGQLGTAAGTDTRAPVPVAGDITYLGVDVGWMHSCGIGTGGSVQCWGNNEQGQLSSGNRTERTVPPGVRERTTLRRKQHRADGKLVLTSFNILGSQHTQPGGGAPQYAPGRVRTEWAGNLLELKQSDIVSFQELQHDQFNQLRATLGDTYTFYPEDTIRNPKVVWQSIMWRTSEWDFVEAEDVVVPVIGKTRPNPIVRLRNKATGKDIWVFNVHNSSKRTPQRQKERNRAVRIEIDEINQRRKAKVPVVFMGDMNERQVVFCKVTGQTDLTAATGGSRTKRACKPPKVMHLDWIFASPEFKRQTAGFERTPLTNRITDHTVLTATYGFNGA
ncbi:MAG: endonuclease/exonuclease/phosphatase family protein, partial [Nocardioides sp.]